MSWEAFGQFSAAAFAGAMVAIVALRIMAYISRRTHRRALARRTQDLLERISFFLRLFEGGHGRRG